MSTGKEFSDSLDNAVIKENPYFNTMLRILATRCMMQAVYFCSGMVAESEHFHYGLATPIYTHFTSPIRRFVTVILWYQSWSKLYHYVFATINYIYVISPKSCSVIYHCLQFQVFQVNVLTRLPQSAPILYNQYILELNYSH